jgi:hypothetical protein
MYTQQQQDGYRRLGTRREPGLVLLFGILTFGIYYLWWIHEVSRETQEYLGEPDTTPTLEVVLTVVTCGIYIYFWDWKMAEKIHRMQQMAGVPNPTNNNILYLVLNLFGLGIVNSMIEQGHLNEIWMNTERRTPPAYGSPYTMDK